MTTNAILHALADVPDPEFAVSIVDMGLVVDAWEIGGTAYVKLTFTSMGCPATEMIMDDVRERLLKEPGIADVDVEVVWHPIWTARRLSPDARLALQQMGIAV
jgi:metal-sulfur cluster biosynthetic enzyme